MHSSGPTRPQATFVNAFVNAGFGTDKLLTAAEESSESVSWIYKNKAREPRWRLPPAHHTDPPAEVHRPVFPVSGKSDR